MIQVRRDPDLTEEPLAAECYGQLGTEDFDRDLAVMFEVAAEIHRRHTTCA